MKTFSNTYINNSDILYKAVVGFEFEFYSKLSYYKIMEMLNLELSPIKVHGFRKYHSDFKPDELNFKIEPDLSGGMQLIELITGPLPYVNCKIILLKILNFIQKYCYTTDKCSIHINISFDKDKSKKILHDLNCLRLILDVDENYIYELFPSRENNFYAKSVKKIIPFKNYNYASDAINILQSNLLLPETKYYGININNYTAGRLEYRYVGGKDYEYEVDSILKLLDYFILLTYDNIDVKLDAEFIEKLERYLSSNINVFKNFSKLENFIAEFPTVSLEVDKRNDISIVSSYYGNIYDEIYDLVMNTKSLRDCIINYNTDNKRIEIVEANIKGIYNINNFDLIDCNVNNGVYNYCNFIDCDIKNAHIEDCKTFDGNIFNCKITETIVNDTIIEDSYFYGGVMNGNMKSGVFRSGKIGENGKIGDDVKIVNDDENYFNTRTGQNDDKKKKSVKHTGTSSDAGNVFKF
jgi:hypothetical protein